MEIETITVISTISAEEYERKNYVSIMIDNFNRNQGHMWRKAKRHEIGGSGMWKCDPTRLKLSLHKLADGVRPVMIDCYGPKKLEYFENMPELEKKIFGYSYSSQDHLLNGGDEFDILLLD